jgi:hypothetical protein
MNTFCAYEVMSSHNGSKIIQLLEDDWEICISNQLISLLTWENILENSTNLRGKAVSTKIHIATLL